MFTRKHSNNIFSSWWWTIDRITLFCVLILISFSAVMVTTASPSIADRIGLDSFYFVKRQLIYLVLSVIIIFLTSLLSPNSIRKISFMGMILFFALLILVLLIGNDIKGAKRWLTIGGFSIQPSEFIKPFFAVTMGWVLSLKYISTSFPVFRISSLIFLSVVIVILLQPDLGMALTITAIWAGQLFLAGLSMIWIVIFIFCTIFSIIGAYLIFPHVANRINSFLDPSVENYQIKKSISAFLNGGVYGKGPGEGTVKQTIPDSHSDFIFAVIGEELGMIVCLLIIFLFALIVLRGFIRISRETDLFSAFAVSGLLIQFGVQAVINIGVTLHILPTKGMTLPFISYGGSSIFAVSIAIGIMLGLTRKKYGYRHRYRN